MLIIKEEMEKKKSLLLALKYEEKAKDIASYWNYLGSSKNGKYHYYGIPRKWHHKRKYLIVDSKGFYCNKILGYHYKVGEKGCRYIILGIWNDFERVCSQILFEEWKEKRDALSECLDYVFK